MYDIRTAALHGEYLKHDILDGERKLLVSTGGRRPR